MNLSSKIVFIFDNCFGLINFFIRLIEQHCWLWLDQMDQFALESILGGLFFEANSQKLVSLHIPYWSCLANNTFSSLSQLRGTSSSIRIGWLTNGRVVLSQCHRLGVGALRMECWGLILSDTRFCPVRWVSGFYFPGFVPEFVFIL